MQRKSARALAVGSILMLFSLTACSGGNSGDSQPMVTADGQDAPGGQSSDTDGIQDDAISPIASPQCDAPDFDIAELVFTESDRQWYCSVSSSQTVSSDEVFFSRSGTAMFSQYGQIYWNRNLSDDSLTIASPLITTKTMRDINSANTTLQFKLVDEAAGEALYDCVLVQRDVSSS